MESWFADWSKLELEVLLFAAAYKARKLPNGERTPEEYVRLAAADIRSGVYGFELDGRSLFAFVANAIAHRIDEDARRVVA